MTVPAKDSKKIDTGQAAPAERHAMVVLGMHRSGTSALTRTLNLLGCAVPQTLLPPTPDNPRGHWEPAQIVAFNDEIMDLAGSRWDDWLPFNPRFSKSPNWHHLIGKARTLLKQEYADAPLLVLKDPRICRLAPFWLEALDREAMKPFVILPIRHPLEIARSLAARDGLAEHEGLLLWLRYVLDAEWGTRGRSRMFVTYDRLLGDWNGLADDISRHSGIAWPRLSPITSREVEDHLSPSDRHQSVYQDRVASAGLSPWIGKAFAIFARWAETGETDDDHAEIDVLREQLNSASDMFARPMLDLQRMRTDLVREREELARGLTDARDQVATLAAQHSEVVQQRDTLTEERNNLESARSDLAVSHAELQQKKSELVREQAQAAADHDALRASHSSLLIQNTALSHERDTLAQERETWLLERAEMSRLCETLTSDLATSDERASHFGREADRMRADYLGRESDLRHELAVTRSTLLQREEELSQLGTELTAARDDHGREMRGRLQRIEELDSLLTKHAEATAKARSEISERFSEIAQLSALLRASEHAAETRREDSDWLRAVNMAILKAPRWWSLLPTQMRWRWQEDRLRLLGLFDAQAYFSRYPDVAQAGMPALRHYLVHGLSEGRVR